MQMFVILEDDNEVAQFAAEPETGDIVVKSTAPHMAAVQVRKLGEKILQHNRSNSRPRKSPKVRGEIEGYEWRVKSVPHEDVPLF